MGLGTLCNLHMLYERQDNFSHGGGGGQNNNDGTKVNIFKTPGTYTLTGPLSPQECIDRKGMTLWK